MAAGRDLYVDVRMNHDLNQQLVHLNDLIHWYDWMLYTGRLTLLDSLPVDVYIRCSLFFCMPHVPWREMQIANDHVLSNACC